MFRWIENSGLVAHGVELVVKLLVLLLGNVGRLALHSGSTLLWTLSLSVSTYLPSFHSLTLPKAMGTGQEAAVLLQQGLDLRILGVFE